MKIDLICLCVVICREAKGDSLCREARVLRDNMDVDEGLMGLLLGGLVYYFEDYQVEWNAMQSGFHHTIKSQVPTGKAKICFGYCQRNGQKSL